MSSLVMCTFPVVGLVGRRTMTLIRPQRFPPRRHDAAMLVLCFSGHFSNRVIGGVDDDEEDAHNDGPVRSSSSRMTSCRRAALTSSSSRAAADLDPDDVYRDVRGAMLMWRPRTRNDVPPATRCAADDAWISPNVPVISTLPPATAAARWYARQAAVHRQFTAADAPQVAIRLAARQAKGAINARRRLACPEGESQQRGSAEAQEITCVTSEPRIFAVAHKSTSLARTDEDRLDGFMRVALSLLDSETASDATKKEQASTSPSLHPVAADVVVSDRSTSSTMANPLPVFTVAAARLTSSPSSDSSVGSTELSPVASSEPLRLTSVTDDAFTKQQQCPDVALEWIARWEPPHTARLIETHGTSGGAQPLSFHVRSLEEALLPKRDDDAGDQQATAVVGRHPNWVWSWSTPCGLSSDGRYPNDNRSWLCDSVLAVARVIMLPPTTTIDQPASTAEVTKTAPAAVALQAAANTLTLLVELSHSFLLDNVAENCLRDEGAGEGMANDSTNHADRHGSGASGDYHHVAHRMNRLRARDVAAAAAALSTWLQAAMTAATVASSLNAPHHLEAISIDANGAAEVDRRHCLTRVHTVASSLVASMTTTTTTTTNTTTQGASSASSLAPEQPEARWRQALSWLVSGTQERDDDLGDVKADTRAVTAYVSFLRSLTTSDRDAFCRELVAASSSSASSRGTSPTESPPSGKNKSEEDSIPQSVVVRLALEALGRANCWSSVLKCHMCLVESASGDPRRDNASFLLESYRYWFSLVRDEVRGSSSGGRDLHRRRAGQHDGSEAGIPVEPLWATALSLMPPVVARDLHEDAVATIMAVAAAAASPKDKEEMGNGAPPMGAPPSHQLRAFAHTWRASLWCLDRARRQQSRAGRGMVATHGSVSIAQLTACLRSFDAEAAEDATADVMVTMQAPPSPGANEKGIPERSAAASNHNLAAPPRIHLLLSASCRALRRQRPGHFIDSVMRSDDAMDDETVSTAPASMVAARERVAQFALDAILRGETFVDHSDDVANESPRHPSRLSEGRRALLLDAVDYYVRQQRQRSGGGSSSSSHSAVTVAVGVEPPWLAALHVVQSVLVRRGLRPHRTTIWNLMQFSELSHAAIMGVSRSFSPSNGGFHLPTQPPSPLLSPQVGRPMLLDSRDDSRDIQESSSQAAVPHFASQPATAQRRPETEKTRDLAPSAAVVSATPWTAPFDENLDHLHEAARADHWSLACRLLCATLRSHDGSPAREAMTTQRTDSKQRHAIKPPHWLPSAILVSLRVSAKSSQWHAVMSLYVLAGQRGVFLPTSATLKTLHTLAGHGKWELSVAILGNLLSDLQFQRDRETGDVDASCRGDAGERRQPPTSAPSSLSSNRRGGSRQHRLGVSPDDLDAALVWTCKAMRVASAWRQVLELYNWAREFRLAEAAAAATVGHRPMSPLVRGPPPRVPECSVPVAHLPFSAACEVLHACANAGFTLYDMQMWLRGQHSVLRLPDDHGAACGKGDRSGDHRHVPDSSLKFASPWSVVWSMRREETSSRTTEHEALADKISSVQREASAGAVNVLAGSSSAASAVVFFSMYDHLSRSSSMVPPHGSEAEARELPFADSPPIPSSSSSSWLGQTAWMQAISLYSCLLVSHRSISPVPDRTVHAERPPSTSCHPAALVVKGLVAGQQQPHQPSHYRQCVTALLRTLLNRDQWQLALRVWSVERLLGRAPQTLSRHSLHALLTVAAERRLGWRYALAIMAVSDASQVDKLVVDRYVEAMCLDGRWEQALTYVAVVWRSSLSDHSLSRVLLCPETPNHIALVAASRMSYDDARRSVSSWTTTTLSAGKRTSASGAVFPVSARHVLGKAVLQRTVQLLHDAGKWSAAIRVASRLVMSMGAEEWQPPIAEGNEPASAHRAAECLGVKNATSSSSSAEAQRLAVATTEGRRSALRHWATPALQMRLAMCVRLCGSDPSEIRSDASSLWMWRREALVILDELTSSRPASLSGIVALVAADALELCAGNASAAAQLREYATATGAEALNP